MTISPRIKHAMRVWSDFTLVWLRLTRVLHFQIAIRLPRLAAALDEAGVWVVAHHRVAIVAVVQADFEVYRGMDPESRTRIRPRYVGNVFGITGSVSLKYGSGS